MNVATDWRTPGDRAIPLGHVRVAPEGVFEGYASLFEHRDMTGDVVARGAFASSLQGRRASSIKMLFQHDAKEPIGVWDRITEDGRGLFVRGRLMTEVWRAREVLSLMRAGAIDGLSIGFRAVKGRKDARTGVRRLTEIDLWEISIVTFPMLPDARVSHVKAAPRAEAKFIPLSERMSAAARSLRER